MDLILFFTLVSLFILLPLFLASYAAYYFISLPLRRQERGRILIDLLEIQSDSNATPRLAEAIREFSTIKDSALGVRFHVLAAHLEQGLTFAEAIKRVPRLLLRSIQSMLSTGETLGNYRKTLPACQGVLNDASNTVNAMSRNYFLLLLIMIPTTVVLFLMHTFFWPKFLSILSTYTADANAPLPTFIQFTADVFPILIYALVTALGALSAMTIAYIGGPRLQRWLERGLAPIADYWAWIIPWRRARIHRNFSMMLGILLDEGVPEADAIPLAADAAGNRYFVRRSRRCLKALKNGQPLGIALQQLDPSSELGWRLRLASKHEGGFRQALQGWWEWLDARACRQEQMAAQAISTGLILVNGLGTGLIAYSVIYGLTQITNQVVLW